MGAIKRQITRILIFSFFTLLLTFLSSPVFAQSGEEQKFLIMYFNEDELEVISATKSLISVTRVAENITVITAEDIELMNAHTLADVLNTVTGVQVFMEGGPGTLATPFIQGSAFRHVTVFMDGVPLNNLGDNVALISSVPVQNIEKIEVIKGPASSVWGSSLGGIVNVITKSPAGKDIIKGTASVSYGKEITGDLRAEIYGRKDKFGYYLSAGRLQSDGLTKGFDVSENNIYAKLTYDITEDTDILFTVFYNRADIGEGENQEFDLSYSNRLHQLSTTLSLNSSLGNGVNLNLSLWSFQQFYNMYTDLISTGEGLYKYNYDDRKYGMSTKLTWKYKKHNIVVGADYDDGTLRSNAIADGEQGLQKWALFANDTIIWDKLSVTLGIRYDNTDTNGDFTSPSLGITYNLSDDTILRAYIARGFSIPSLYSTFGDNVYYASNPDLDVEKVWSYQIGVETGKLKYLWLKISAFRHEIRDAIDEEFISEEPLLFTFVNKGKQRRQGIEIETKTIPVYHTALFAGATFIHTKDLNTDETVRNVPRYTYDIGIKYDDEKSLKALFKGHYIWWNGNSFYGGKYNSFIFDINIIKSLYKQNGRILEVFLTAHNIFNGSQYKIDSYENPGRWIEGGLRYKF
jgi:vitamin B12 transporter